VYGSLDLTNIAQKYQITNDATVLQITPSLSAAARNYSLTLTGCENTLNHPFTFNSSSSWSLGTITDSAGGKTEYWDLTTQAEMWVDGVQWTNDALIGSLGLLEVYESP
jgi:hypothetical protein